MPCLSPNHNVKAVNTNDDNKLTKLTVKNIAMIMNKIKMMITMSITIPVTVTYLSTPPVSLRRCE